MTWINYTQGFQAGMDSEAAGKVLRRKISIAALMSLNSTRQPSSILECSCGAHQKAISSVHNPTINVLHQPPNSAAAGYKPERFRKLGTRDHVEKLSAADL